MLQHIVDQTMFQFIPLFSDLVLVRISWAENNEVGQLFQSLYSPHFSNLLFVFQHMARAVIV
jgi:hypothetical protein